MRAAAGLIGVLLAVAFAAPQPRPLLALADGGLDAPSRLVRLDPASLTVEPGSRPGLRLPGWAFGVKSAWSPDGSRVAIVPKPNEAAERVHVVDTRTLALRWRLALFGRDVCALAWPRPQVLLALVAERPCYWGNANVEVLQIDTAKRRIASRASVHVGWSVDATARVRDGLAALARNVLVVATAGGVRRVELPVMPAAAAIASGEGRTFVAAADGSLAAVGPDGRVEVHRPRMTASAQKGDRDLVSAAWLGDGMLAVGRGRQRGGTNVPLGAGLVDTRTWRIRRLDDDAVGVARAGDRLLTYGRDGLRVYTRDGRLVLHALRGLVVTDVRVHGRYAYASRIATTDVVDLATGRETRSAAAQASVYGLLLP